MLGRFQGQPFNLVPGSAIQPTSVGKANFLLPKILYVALYSKSFISNHFDSNKGGGPPLGSGSTPQPTWDGFRVIPSTHPFPTHLFCKHGLRHAGLGQSMAGLARPAGAGGFLAPDVTARTWAWVRQLERDREGLREWGLYMMPEEFWRVAMAPHLHSSTFLIRACRSV